MGESVTGKGRGGEREGRRKQSNTYFSTTFVQLPGGYGTYLMRWLGTMMWAEDFGPHR